jgi:site-specific DNA recombinase
MGWAASYGRVSLYRPHLNQHTPENHERLIRKAAQSYGLQIRPGYEFYDYGFSGSTTVRRPGYERAMRAVIHKEVEALFVPTVDRLSRRGFWHIGELLDAVEAAQGRIIFVHECLDSSVPIGRSSVETLAEQARAESKTMSWRAKVWREGCRLRGEWTGKRPYGYRVEDGRLVLHPYEAPVVGRIVAAFLQGKSFRAIAEALNADSVLSPGAAKAAELRAKGREPRGKTDTTWGMATVRAVLLNPALAGWGAHNGQVVLGLNGDPVCFGESILTPDDRGRVLAEAERRAALVRPSRSADRKPGGRGTTKYLLTGFAKCASCGYAMAGHKHSQERIGPYYRCTSAIQGYTCSGRGVMDVAKADEEVRQQITARLLAMEPADPILDAMTERCRALAIPFDPGVLLGHYRARKRGVQHPFCTAENC